MIKENFIRLFEDSFRKNWDLNAYTNYGENLTLTYAQVAEKLQSCTCCLNNLS